MVVESVGRVYRIGMTSQETAAPVHVLVWAEHVEDQSNQAVREIYPATLHETIAEALRRILGPKVAATTATFHDPHQGLDADRLNATDVLIWWSHLIDDRIDDEAAERVRHRVLDGMGLIVLHSGSLSKAFRGLMGTRCTFMWREGNDRELLWTVAPTHPIAQGVPHPVVIPVHEMYGEFFDVPEPDSLVFVSSFTGGEIMRSGMCWSRGLGRVFYFSPGHEEHPIYHQAEIQRILANAVLWCAPQPHAFTTDAWPARETGWFESR